MTTQYIIRTDEPFRGNTESILLDDGTVAYTDGLTLAEYQADSGFPCRVVPEAELFQLVTAHEQTLKTDPQPITKQRFWDMLEVLPPCRWHHAGGFEVFHVSEHLTGMLVSWFARAGEDYYEFVDSCRLSDAGLVAKLKAAS